MNLDLSRLPIVGAYTHGLYYNYIPKKKYCDSDNGVYLIVFADGEKYIGTSSHLRRRIYQHYNSMSHSRGLPQLVKAFRKTNEYTVYLLTDKFQMAFLPKNTLYSYVSLI